MEDRKKNGRQQKKMEDDLKKIKDDLKKNFNQKIKTILKQNEKMKTTSKK